ncbi:hypothetical protein M422DRAFT_262990 [Sphaerobolus stellatus SS14]|uniref:Uncharacterized protein n=1 Tax=Sphaerobolus stellatus (strain SS14) TaxID=990650 RepID=A0A0C9UIV3_SPHS4|nr:hypothetical protein M422DRAFT_262990 [Sphaerobolus stellatus SS14]
MSSLEERKQLLFDDPDISEVEAHRVFCNRCEKWLKLDEVKLYAASVWRCHKNTKSHNARPISSSTPASQRPTDGSHSASPVTQTPTARSASSGDLPRNRRFESTNVPFASAPIPRLKVQIPNSGLRESSSTSAKAALESNKESNSQETSNLDNSTSKQTPSESRSSLREDGRSPGNSPNFKSPILTRPVSASNKYAISPSNPLNFKVPEHLNPQRKASYKALMAEPYIGKLEPFRAFCTLCNVWVNLSSRTPYSYGVWKGHVRKSEKQSVNTSNADDEYDTASDHSQEDGPASTFRRGTSSRRIEESIVIKSVSLRLSSGPDKRRDEVTGEPVRPSMNPSTTAVESPSDTPDQNIRSVDASNPDEIRDVAANQDDSATGQPDTLNNQQSLQTDDSNLTPQKKASLISLERRRQTMLEDPDAAEVESRRVKCGICSRWIKGSNTQEYSLHHWIKHRKKCARNKRPELSEGAEERKIELEADPDIKTLEVYRAHCGLCNKWVKLDSRNPYSTTSWLQHKSICPRSFEHHEGTMETVSDPEARQQALSLDPDILELWHDRVQCRHCEQTIALSSSIPYMPDHWVSHKAKCPQRESAIAARLDASSKIREEFLRKEQALGLLEAHRAECKACNAWVDLDATTPYSLDQWEEHRKSSHDSTIGSTVKVNSNEEDPEARDVEQALKVGPDAAEPQSPSSKLKYTESQKDEQGNFENYADAVDADVIMEDAANAEKSCELHEPNKESASSAHTSNLAANERIAYFIRQSDVLAVEAHKAMCGRCLTWVPLGDDEICGTHKWETHKSKCNGLFAETVPHGLRSGTQHAAKPSIRVRTNGVATRPVRPLPKAKSKGMAKRGPSPMTLPPLPPRPRWPGEDERKQQLFEDPDMLRVEPHRLLCKHCNCWIKLHPIIRYSQSVWPRHKAACKEAHATPPQLDARQRAKTEKEDIRRQLLEDDPYVTEISPHRVTCKACGTSIRLDTTYKYEGSHWRAHRSRCPQIPFADRALKKRKGGDGRRASLQESPRRHAMAEDSSSNSDDSDASSAPRPRPIAFFTQPLIINPLAMFDQPPHPEGLSDSMDVQHESNAKDLQNYLVDLAMEITASDRLEAVIEASLSSSERKFGDERLNNARAAVDEMEVDSEQVDKSQAPPSPSADSTSWIPRKRTREEEQEFDALVAKWPKPASPKPKGKQRSCKLSKESLPVLE